MKHNDEVFYKYSYMKHNDDSCLFGKLFVYKYPNPNSNPNPNPNSNPNSSTSRCPSQALFTPPHPFTHLDVHSGPLRAPCILSHISIATPFTHLGGPR